MLINKAKTKDQRRKRRRKQMGQLGRRREGSRMEGIADSRVAGALNALIRGAGAGAGGGRVPGHAGAEFGGRQTGAKQSIVSCGI